MEEIFYGDVNHIQLGNDIYEIQSIEFNDEKFFIIKQSGKVVCVLMQNEKNEWEADCDMSDEQLSEIMKRITKFYYE